LAFLQQRQERLCHNCRRRIERNPLRALDCKEPGCIQATQDAPSILDSLCSQCREHFATVQRLLRATGVGFTLNSRMVRGLDYYCRTAFEWTTAKLGSQSAVAAGGRYDGLVQALGGPAIPGVGFAIGVERIAMLLKMQERPAFGELAIYVVWVGENARDWAFPVVHQLRQKGLAVEMEGDVRSLKSQMRRADKLQASSVLIIGDEELNKGVAILRDMASKQQEEVRLDNLVAVLAAQRRS
jgi:histidyl-tRNA synthetase